MPTTRGSCTAISSPPTFLLDARGAVWVTDFGLAKANDQQNLTDTGDILGTIRYMPPEAFDGKTDARGDVYSLGLTLYELLALRPAFAENDRRRLMKEVTTAEPARLDKLNRSIPRDMATMVHKAIDREPAHRYQTAGNWRRTCSASSTMSRFGRDGSARASEPGAGAGANPAVACLMAAVFLLLATVAGVTSAAALHFDAARIQEQNLRQAAVTAFTHEQEQRLHAEKARAPPRQRRRARRSSAARLKRPAPPPRQRKRARRSSAARPSWRAAKPNGRSSRPTPISARPAQPWTTI